MTDVKEVVKAEKKAPRGKVRTDDDLLAGSKKEKMFAFLRTAFNVEKGKGGKFAGSKLATVEAPASLFGGAGKKTSHYWDIDEKDEKFTTLYDLMKSAEADMKDEKWTPAVAKAVDQFLGLQRAGGGARVKTAAKLKDKTF